MNTNGDNKNVQQAIINSVENSVNKDQDISSILSQYNSRNDQQKVKYLTVLLGIGGKDALEAVIETGKTNNADLKNAVILSLANWKDQSALQTLIDLSRTTTKAAQLDAVVRSEENTSELQSLMRISYAVVCLKTKKELSKTPKKNS